MKWIKLTKLEEKIDKNDLKYEVNISIYDFQQFQTIRYFSHCVFMISL